MNEQLKLRVVFFQIETGREYDCMRYPIVIYKDPDRDYGMMVPDLPGCYTFGNTIADVLTQAVEAIECHLEGMLIQRTRLKFGCRSPTHSIDFFRWFSQTAQILR